MVRSLSGKKEGSLTPRPFSVEPESTQRRFSSRFVVVLAFVISVIPQLLAGKVAHAVENGTSSTNQSNQTDTTIVRTVSQTTGSLISGRITFLTQPNNCPPPSPQTIPTPTKDNAALGAGGNVMMANATEGLPGQVQNVSKALVTGIAAGYQAMDLKTSYNNGWNKNYGLTAMPYASYSFTDTLVADAAFGLTWVNNSISRVATPANVDVRGDYPSLRSLGTANLTYYYQLDDWTFSAKGGLLLTNEHRYSYSESNGANHQAGDTFLGEIMFGGKASYRYKQVNFLAGLNYIYDFATELPNDRNEIQALVGVDCRLTDSLMFNVELNNAFLRQKSTNTGLVGTLRYEF